MTQKDSQQAQTSAPRRRGGIAGYILIAVLALAVGGAGALGVTAYLDGDSTEGRTATQAQQDRQDRSATRQTQTQSRFDLGRDGARVTPVQQRVGDTTIPDLVERLLPAVVSIAVTQGGAQQDPRAERPDRNDPRDDFRRYFRDRPEFRGSAVGSGFIIDSDGYIVTNHHVVANASDVRVIMHDGTQFDAEVVGLDPRADIALVKIEAEDPLPTVSWGDSSTVRVGESVIAIGNPFGLSSTVTAGIVSARGRFIPGRARQASFVDFIQTDAAINRGNSGGPLFNMSGEVIGINTAIYSNRGTNVGVAFAVPSDIARGVVDQLRQYGRTRRGWLGVSIQTVTPEIAQSIGLEEATGALVANVLPDSPAARAGILRGDVILRFNGRTVPDNRRLPRLVAGTPSGEEVEVVVWRQGREVTVSVTLGELEQASQQTGKPGSQQQQQDNAQLTVQGMRLAALTDELRQRYRLSEDVNGLVILEVERESRAAEKGLQPGDVILEANQQEVTEPAQFREQVETARQAGRGSILLLIESEGGNRRFVALRIEE